MPTWITHYWKTIIAVLGLVLTILTSLNSVLGDDVPEWVPIAIAVVSAVLVYQVPNTPLETTTGEDAG